MVFFATLIALVSCSDVVQPSSCEGSYDLPQTPQEHLSAWLYEGDVRAGLDSVGKAADELDEKARMDVFEGKLLVDDKECATIPGAFENMSIFAAVALLAQGDTSHVYVARNGENSGVWLPYERGCVASLAQRAAIALGANAVDVSLPKRLVTAGGLPVGDDDEVWMIGRGLLHVLMDQETFVWAGFEVGFEWRVGGGWRLQTVALRPKIVYAHNLLADDECDLLIEAAKSRLAPSPTKDYSDAEAFKNFRTSETAHIGGDVEVGRTVRYRTWFVTRLPKLSCVEETQVVMYGNPDAWFKPHMDVYHDWPGFPDERLRRKKASTEDPGTAAVVEFELWVEGVQRLLANGELGDNPEAHVPGGFLPSETDGFQFEMVRLVLDSPTEIVPSDWQAWLKENLERKATGLFVALIKAHPAAWLAAKSRWYAACHDATLVKTLSAVTGDEDLVDKPLKRIVPNRHVTGFHYLNDVERGGETVFPRAEATQWNGTDTWKPEPRPKVPECEQGLAVRPRKGNTAIFYHRLGDMSIDQFSQHGGCPPVGEGTAKWGANSFSWNIDNRRGYKIWYG